MIHERIYFDPGDTSVFLDTYVVTDRRIPPRDAMLVIPGGAYAVVCGDREGEHIALEFVAKGINAFVLTYSTGDKAVFPRQLLDAARAVKLIKDKANDFHINPNRVFAVGFSAGGHLCGTLAVHNKIAEVELGLEENSLKLTGAILSYPVVTAYGETHKGSFNNLLKKPFEELTEDEKHLHSIECNVTSETPPMFIWHTSEDRGVPIYGSLKLAAANYALGKPVELHIYPYGPHGVSLANEVTSAGIPEMIAEEATVWITDALRWMKKL